MEAIGTLLQLNLYDDGPTSIIRTHTLHLIIAYV